MSPPTTDPSYEDFLKFWMLSIMLSAAGYGVVVTLCFSCIDLLRKTTTASQRRTNRMLIIFVCAMLIVSTTSIIASVILVTEAIFSPTPFDGDIRGATATTCIVLSNWGADGFLLWRCASLYEGVSRMRRRVILVIVSFMGLMLFAAGVTCLSMAINYNTTANLTIFAVSCTSLLVNIVITFLIIARISHLSSTIQSSLGKSHWSKYRRVVAMLVESAALIVLFGLAYVVLTLALPIKGRFPLESLSAFVPMYSFTHVYVIAPCLIIYRVAQGKAWSAKSGSTLSGSTDVESTQRRGLQSLPFKSGTSTNTNGQSQEIDSMVELDSTRFSESHKRNLSQ